MASKKDLGELDAEKGCGRREQRKESDGAFPPRDSDDLSKFPTSVLVI
jgi:hypothetical protein